MDDLVLYPISRFDELFAEEVKLYFPEGLLGFPWSTEFILREDSEALPYFYLEQLGSSISFVVCDPFTFFPNYTPSFAKADLQQLGVGDSAILLLLTLVNIKTTPYQLNVRAPLLIAWEERRGRQVLIQEKKD